MYRELIKGHLDLLLLALVAPRPAHGYAIIGALREESGGAFDLPEGTVYPALHRLERGGLLESYWSEADGRRRRVYEISTLGREALAERRHAWRGFSSAVEAVLGGGA
jgi:DNA-binding PadR family transcriptional regulator